MANKDTGWSCTHGAWIQSQNDTSATIRVVAYWQNVGWTYDIDYTDAWVYADGAEWMVMDEGSITTTGDTNKSQQLGYHDFVISKGTSGRNVPVQAKIYTHSGYVTGTKWSTAGNVWIGAKTSYTVSYNANGGSGAPGNQTKWYGTQLTLSSTKPTRTGYSFVRWNTNTSNTGTGYTPGGAYTGNANLTLYAIWSPDTYTVTYNANGGSGAPGNQTKTYGVNLTLSSTKPTKTNYNFLGWSTSQNGGVVYPPGATYTDNAPITLYAVWELAYVKPRLNNFSAERCTSNGTVSDSGTYIKVTFDWATDRNVTAIWIDWSTYADFHEYSNAQVTASGKSGSVSKIIGDGQISTETSYYVRSYVSDDMDFTHSGSVPIGTIKFPIDVRKQGLGVAVGKVAEEDHVFDVGFYSKFRDDVMFMKDIRSKDHGYYKAFRGYASNVNDAKSHGYYNTNDGTSGLPEGVNKYGLLEVFESRGTTWDHSDGSSWVWQTYRNTSGDTYRRYGVNDANMSAWKLDSLYPIGSIYLSVNSTNPKDLFGGTWEQIGGRFLVGAGKNAANTTDYWGACAAGAVDFPNGEMGGEPKHTLSAAEMPSHTHGGSTSGAGGHSHTMPFKGFGNVTTTTNGWFFGRRNVSGDGNDGWWDATSWVGDHSHSFTTGAAGSSYSHNNLPPYLVVYMWKRVS